MHLRSDFPGQSDPDQIPDQIIGTGPGDLRLIAKSPRYVVVEKPTGLLSVPGKGESKADCAAARVRQAFPLATGPLVVHRLDMETSGLMVFALDASAQRELSMEFEARRTRKAYVALVAGSVTRDEGTIDLPMRADLDRRPIQIVDHLQGRPAQTRYRVMAREIDRTRLRLEPITGRTHQLRVHCAHQHGLGCPIMGDSLYAASETPSPVSGQPPRLMLHASELAFREPGSGNLVEFRIPVPF